MSIVLEWFVAKCQYNIDNYILCSEERKTTLLKHQRTRDNWDARERVMATTATISNQVTNLHWCWQITVLVNCHWLLVTNVYNYSSIIGVFSYIEWFIHAKFDCCAWYMYVVQTWSSVFALFLYWVYATRIIPRQLQTSSSHASTLPAES